MIRFVRKCFQKHFEPHKTKTVLLAILKLHVFLIFKWLGSLRFLQVSLACAAGDYNRPNKGANSYGTYCIDKQ